MTKMARGTESKQLSEAQSRYLEALRASEALPAGLRLDHLLLEGSSEAVEALREKLTHALAERGFAEDYTANAEGELIESLIDCLV